MNKVASALRFPPINSILFTLGSNVFVTVKPI